MQKKCFVAMPIKAPGTDLYKHYRAMFDSVIAPTARSFGYETKRADDFQHAGAITKDIIVPLATWDLVVADLTDLNPNVFYELGVRHALRGLGTIMIMDEEQTAIPFDIHAYRVIKFRSDVPGIADLRDELSKYINQIEQRSVVERDNLVHDWLPALPEDILDFVSQGVSGSHTQILERTREQLRAYVDRYGPLKETPGAIDARITIRAALEDARAENLPTLIVSRAEKLAAKGDVVGFLEQVDALLNLKSLRPDRRMMTRLRYAAASLDLSTVKEAVMDHAVYMFPGDRDLERERLETLCHSDDVSRQQEAVVGLKLILGISDGEPPTLARPLTRSDFSTLGLMLDAYHRQRLHEDALKITTVLVEANPGKAIVLRNHARALVYTGQLDRALDVYQQAAKSGDADDTTLVWFAGELADQGRGVDATEAYAAACVYDPDDPNDWSYLAGSLATALRLSESNAFQPRSLPPELRSSEYVQLCIAAAMARAPLLSSAYERLRNAAQRAEVDFEELQKPDSQMVARLVIRKNRLELAKSIHTILASDLTPRGTVATSRINAT